MINQQLIDNALKLCGKSMDDMNIPRYLWDSVVNWMAFPEFWEEFSYPNFFYYILDRQFLIKYYQNNKPWYTPHTATTDLMSGEFGYAIMEYQSWNPEPIEDLLCKI